MTFKFSPLLAGLITAVASSLCCITPVVALLAGTSGIASTFSWIDSLRPYLFGATFLLLGYAWYIHLKPTQRDSCGCSTPKKSRSFVHSGPFLMGMTLFAVFTTAFPHFTNVINFKEAVSGMNIPESDVQTSEFAIEGMTCSGCEDHVKTALGSLDGIVEIQVSYSKGNALVKFDKNSLDTSQLAKAIRTTGYQVVILQDR